MKEYRLSPNGNLYTYDEYMEKVKNLDMHNDDLGFIIEMWESYPVIPVRTKKQLERLKYIYKKPEKDTYQMMWEDTQHIMIWGTNPDKLLKL